VLLLLLTDGREGARDGGTETGAEKQRSETGTERQRRERESEREREETGTKRQKTQRRRAERQRQRGGRKRRDSSGFWEQCLVSLCRFLEEFLCSEQVFSCCRFVETETNIFF
jgi:hypothetical protein